MYVYIHIECKWCFTSVCHHACMRMKKHKNVHNRTHKKIKEHTKTSADLFITWLTNTCSICVAMQWMNANVIKLTH